MSRFTGFQAAGFALAALLVAPAASHAAVQVARSSIVATDVPPKVVQECQLATLVPLAIQAAGGDVQIVDGKPQGRWLELTVSEVHAPGGGFFSGPKWMTVTGKLYERGKVVGSFRVKRVSSAMKSTCGTVQRIATVIGQDIAAWLKAPSMNAELGR